MEGVAGRPRSLATGCTSPRSSSSVWSAWSARLTRCRCRWRPARPSSAVVRKVQRQASARAPDVTLVDVRGMVGKHFVADMSNLSGDSQVFGA